MTLNLLLLFLAGLIQDALHALYVKSTASGHYVYAALLSLVITFIAYGVAVSILETLNSGSLGHLATYSIGAGIGSGLGTWLAVRHKT